MYFESNEIWSLQYSLLLQIICFIIYTYVSLQLLEKMMWKEKSDNIFEDGMDSGMSGIV